VHAGRYVDHQEGGGPGEFLGGQGPALTAGSAARASRSAGDRDSSREVRSSSVIAACPSPNAPNWPPGWPR
ncbi:hypothetical protein PV702_33285, partial [Streptomyces sp. FL06-04B]|uniref:hypothetical protein n=1 Tax=Streptomyces sp. FL06-04B TaxID=3028657 RepID=UPI00299FB29D